MSLKMLLKKDIKKGDLTRSIGCITSNSSVLHKMINEVVYSSIITKQAPEIANNYLKDKIYLLQ